MDGVQLLDGVLKLTLTVLITRPLHNDCGLDGSGEPAAHVGTAWSTLQCTPQC